MTLHEMDAVRVVELMNGEELQGLRAVEAAAGQLAVAADRVREVYDADGRIFMLGAGTSGRLVAMEAAELPPTFGVEEGRFVPFIASGPTGGSASITRREDDVEAAPHALQAVGCSSADAVIGVTASGRTPFVLAGIRYGRQCGAWTCGLANNPDTPLLRDVDVALFLDTGPEVLTGSTRLKAGTAQKLALNRISTAAMVVAGRVTSNLMTEVKPATEKLRLRCIRIVNELAGTTDEQSVELLEATDWNIRTALTLHTTQLRRQQTNDQSS